MAILKCELTVQLRYLQEQKDEEDNIYKDEINDQFLSLEHTSFTYSVDN